VIGTRFKVGEFFARLSAVTVLLRSRLLLHRGVGVFIAASFLALATAIGIDVGRDLRQQSAVRQAESQKQQLALVGQLELAHAVQDFKDCLLRGDASYCEGFYRHIQAVDRTVSLYGAQGTRLPDETKALATLRRALSVYRSALYEVRDMQSRHATIQEIDSEVRGEDRPVAAGLSELAALPSGRNSGWRVPPGQAILLMVCATLACLFIYATFLTSIRRGKRSKESAQSLRQLSNRMIAWEEDKDAKAFVRLHDGVCQSLSAIMYFLKSAQHVSAGGHLVLSELIPEPVIPSLQAVIQDARAVALQLRPPRMQEAGVLATLRSLWMDCRVRNPGLGIGPCALLEERDIPEGLKPVILRIAQMTLDFAEQRPSACRVAWVLERDGPTLRLSIDMAAASQVTPEQSPPQTSASTTAFDLLDAIGARVVLSGGSSDVVRNGAGCATIVSTWPLDDSVEA
jgi:signal transduction histidine kinase